MAKPPTPNFLRTYSSLALFGALLLTSLDVVAATITSNGTGGGNWSTGGSWSGGVAPGTTDQVSILAGDVINLTTNQTCGTVTVAGTLGMNTNSRTLTVNGNLVLKGVGSITGNNNTRAITVSGNLTVNLAAAAAVAGINLSIGGITTVTGTVTFTNATGTKTLTGAVTVAGSLEFSAAVPLIFGGGLTIGSGGNVGGGGGTGVITAAGALSVPVGSVTLTTLTASFGGTSSILGTAQLTSGTFSFGTLQIAGTGVLNASGSTNIINVSGNWSNTSTASDAFVQGNASTVNFKGSSGTQTITRTAGTETFDGLSIANTSSTSPGVATQINIQVNDFLTHSSGTFDLAGHSLTLTGGATARTNTLSNGALISSASGATFTVTDPSNNCEIDLTNFRIGSSSQSITTNITSGQIQFTGFTEWGTANFTKTLNVDDVFGGGNYYHGPVTFTADASASRWRMGDNLALPDTFVNATFNANATGGSNNNFIVGANSTGNAFYGTTNMLSTTVGGFFIGRKNGTGNSSATFFGPVTAQVAFTGSITFADAASSNTSSVTFTNTVQASSAASSTGDIFFGGSAYSTVTLTPTAQFINGTLQGQTSINFRNVTQNGSLAQQMVGASNTRIFCGGPSYPNIFNGAVTFTGDTIDISSSTFNGSVGITAASALTFAASNYNGAVNNFTKGGATSSTCLGGNTFIASSTNTFTSTGSGYFRLAGTTADDMNGNARFVQTGAGVLAPAYGTVCTFAGNVSTSGSTTAITFGSGGGTVVLDGAAQKVDGAASLPPIFVRLTTSFVGTLLVNVPLAVQTQLTMNSGLLDLSGNTLTLGTAPGTPGTLTWTNGWVHNGTFKRWFPTAAVTLGNVGGLFPVGSASTDYHPLWFGSTSNLTTGGTLAVQHTPTTSGITAASFADASWGSSVTGISNSAWALTAANGLAVSGTTARIRYGGTGFSPFTLTDLDACQASGVTGTFAASTNTSVPLEVNRTALNTAALGLTWRIGTRNNSQSPLPVELLYFTAKADNQHVLLNWATASEKNNALFTVE